MNLLEAYGATGIPLFDYAIDFGWFWFLTKPIFRVLLTFEGLIGNFGLSIICLTLIVRTILPVVARIGLDIGFFMSGAVVVESVFGWPGIGQLAWQAIQQLDLPIIMGVTLVAAVAIVLGNLIADLVTPLIDPRIRLR